MCKFNRYYIIRKDILKRKNFFRSEKFKNLEKYLKLIKYNYFYSKGDFCLKDPFSYYFLMQDGSRTFNFSNYRSKCLLTGRSRSIYSAFRLSRMQLRSLASFGYLNGVRKSSW
jgi:ribosomal protein S14